MKHAMLASLLLSMLLVCQSAIAASDEDLVKSQGTLLFEDHFDRDEPSADKEAIGNGWTSNSAWRAKGKKQVDLADGVMKVTRAAEADHGVAIFHDTALQDGAVQLKFKLGAGDDLGIDFVDRECKTVHAGHLCMARATLKRVSLRDSKTGAMDLKIQERRLKGDKSPELAALLKTKSAEFPVELNANDWHQILVVVQGDVMRVTLDGKPIGQLKSEGIAHPTKRMITLAVIKSAEVDDVKVWKLK